MARVFGADTKQNVITFEESDERKEVDAVRACESVPRNRSAHPSYDHGAMCDHGKDLRLA